MKTKTKKNEKQKKEKFYLHFVSPTLISKNVLGGLILGRKQKKL